MYLKSYAGLLFDLIADLATTSITLLRSLTIRLKELIFLKY